MLAGTHTLSFIAHAEKQFDFNSTEIMHYYIHATLLVTFMRTKKLTMVVQMHEPHLLIGHRKAQL